MKLGRVRQMRIMYIDDLKKKKTKQVIFLFHHGTPLKKKIFFFSFIYQLSLRG